MYVCTDALLWITLYCQWRLMNSVACIVVYRYVCVRLFQGSGMAGRLQRTRNIDCYK